jgi:ATP-dependent DNA helicase RecQ
MTQVTTPDAALEVLGRVFGYDAFRGDQAEIIQHVVGGGDALVLMPTGGGKSLCYQVPALVREGTGVVISPLIALMQDQVDALAANGVRAEFLNSTQDAAERRRVETAFIAGEIDLLYLAPERLALESTVALSTGRRSPSSRSMRRTVSRSGVMTSAPTTSVSRCCTSAGRPCRASPSRRPRRGRPTPRSPSDCNSEARHFVASFDRPNIQYRIAPKEQPRSNCSTSSAPSIRMPRHRLLPVAGLGGEDGRPARRQRHPSSAVPRWPSCGGSRGEPVALPPGGRLVMVATIAFGMGIDKPDVRFVAHLDLPKSVEGYYQETGSRGSRWAPVDRLARLRFAGCGAAAADDPDSRRAISHTAAG